MGPAQYSLLVAHAKQLALKTLPCVMLNFRELCLPFIHGLAQPLVLLSQESCLKSGDLDSYFDLLKLLSKLLKSYGIGAINIINDVAFQDTELSLSFLLSLLIRLILRKSDTSEVNLQDGPSSKASMPTSVDNLRASKAFASQVQRQKQRLETDDAQMAAASSQIVTIFLSEQDPYTLDCYMQRCLKFLEILLRHPAALHLKAEIRSNLQVTLTQALAVSQLKYASATGLSQKTQQLLLEVSSNIIAFG